MNEYLIPDLGLYEEYFCPCHQHQQDLFDQSLLTPVTETMSAGDDGDGVVLGQSHGCHQDLLDRDDGRHDLVCIGCCQLGDLLRPLLLDKVGLLLLTQPLLLLRESPRILGNQIRRSKTGDLCGRRLWSARSFLLFLLVGLGSSKMYFHSWMSFSSTSY